MDRGYGYGCRHGSRVGEMGEWGVGLEMGTYYTHYQLWLNRGFTRKAYVFSKLYQRAQFEPLSC